MYESLGGQIKNVFSSDPFHIFVFSAGLTVENW